MNTTQTQKKHIVTVGGGFASVKLALELSNNPSYEVTLISPHDQLEYHGALYRSATGRSPLEVVLPFREIFGQDSNVTIVNDLVTELRAQTKEIKGQSGRVYSYDALVLGLGYEIEYYGIRGMREHAESIYTIFDTINLRNSLRDKLVDKAGQEIDVVMIGAGPTGIEAACDLELFTRIVADKYDVERAIPKVTILDRAPRVLPTLLPEVSEIAQARIEELGISTQLGVEVDHCTASHVSLKDKSVLPADIIIWSAGSRASSFFERYPDIFSLDARKRVQVNEYLQANSPDIYVLGDSASTKYSGMAQTAIGDAIQLADNFKRFANGEKIVEYKDTQPIYVVPIGHEWAVAQVGDKISVGDEGWKIRRDADYFVLSSFLPENSAKDHWEKAFQIAQI
jgi:NADH:ubiquinone reductase (H+-translocating)